uniref:hypothetical protein n=1 Tax=Flavobacterium sp. TaxID=239 RepID=UPI00404B858F
MNKIACKTFTAQVTIGLLKGYSNSIIPLKTVKEELVEAQKTVNSDYSVKLSTKIRLCEIIFLGQEEQSVELEFIQYPKFLQEEVKLKKAIIALTEILLHKLEQNRIVIVFTDETIMLEQSDSIDSKIKF